MSKPFMKTRYSYAREQWRREYKKYCNYGKAVWRGLLMEEVTLRHIGKPSYFTDKEYHKELWDYWVDYSEWLDPYIYEKDANPEPKKCIS